MADPGGDNQPAVLQFLLDDLVGYQLAALEVSRMIISLQNLFLKQPAILY